MATIDIPGAKRAGLPVDLDRLTVEGDDWLSAEERYALKMHGVCAQAQASVFMIRIRTENAITSAQARAIASLAETYARGWIHITTRQQLELHHVHARDVIIVLDAIRAMGLTSRSACGHTMRGVMACPDAGVGLDEPFDCNPDARAVSNSILQRTPEIDTKMPQRINIVFGGCPACRDHVKTNDLGFVSVIRNDGEFGYELWLGGSLGKSSPTLAFKAEDFIGRADVLAATHALFDVFIEHGDFDRPAKARLKFLIAKLGRDRFLELFRATYEEARRRPWPAPESLAAPLTAPLSEILSFAPEGGWGSGVRPQRVPGYAMVTVTVPLGDVDAEDLSVLADITDDLGDQNLYLTRNQNVMFRHVTLAGIPAIRAALEGLGLALEGADQSQDVRACTGAPICALALTPAQTIGARLLQHPALVRNSSLRVHVSGCPNACAQHQIADLGFSGSRVTIDGQTVLGYQVWLGGEPRKDILGEVVGRVAEEDVLAITEAIIRVWEALRERGEMLSDTVQRFGLPVFQAQIAAVFRGRWAPGPEPDVGYISGVEGIGPADMRLPMVVGA